MPDRHWRDGLHQAVEAKEGVPINMASEHAAQITFQNFYRLYKKLAGMSGTLLPNFWELRKVYRRWATRVPTNKPSMRDVLPDAVYPDRGREVRRGGREDARDARGRPAGADRHADRGEVGEALGEADRRRASTHQVLNAEQNEGEAEIVAQAGQPGTVTVATNMAGRGTDIKLGAGRRGGRRAARDRHRAARGRADRPAADRPRRPSGRPRHRGVHPLARRPAARRARHEAAGTNSRRWAGAAATATGTRYAPLFRMAQRRVEKQHYKQRLDLMNYDKNRQEMLQDLGADPYVD